MTVVRGILMGLVMCLAATVAPANAATPGAAEQVQAQAAKDNWEVMREWKQGVVRACRGKWDGETFKLKMQLVNTADRGRRGAVIGAKSVEFPTWDRFEVPPIEAGSRVLILDTDVYERPRVVDLRAKVTKGKKKSDWSKVFRADRLNLC